MKSKNLFAVMFITGTILMSSCGKSGAGEEGQSDATRNKRVVSVRVDTLKATRFSETISLTGTIKAVEDVLLSPEEGGVVREWKVEKGQTVQAGTVLALLSDDVVRPTYEGALAQYNTTELTYQKQKSVFEEQAVSEWQLKTAEYARDAARSQSDVTHARLERTRLRSPISGTLEDRMVDAGEMATPGIPIARIVNSARIKLHVNIPELYSGSISLGSRVSFSVVAYRGEEFSGRVTFVGSAISPDNRTFPVEVEMLNPGRKLKPEMIARVKIMQSEPRPALLVREEIVQNLDRDKLVVFVEETGIARERTVVVGGRDGAMVEIRSGLREGDRIIVSGYQLVADGQPVILQ